MWTPRPTFLGVVGYDLRLTSCWLQFVALLPSIKVIFRSSFKTVC